LQRLCQTQEQLAIADGSGGRCDRKNRHQCGCASMAELVEMTVGSDGRNVIAATPATTVDAS